MYYPVAHDCQIKARAVTWAGLGCRMFGHITDINQHAGATNPTARIKRIDGGICTVDISRLSIAAADDVIRACSAGYPGGTLPL